MNHLTRAKSVFEMEIEELRGQAHDFAMAYLQADLVHNGPRFVGFADAFGA